MKIHTRHIGWFTIFICIKYQRELVENNNSRFEIERETHMNNLISQPFPSRLALAHAKILHEHFFTTATRRCGSRGRGMWKIKWNVYEISLLLASDKGKWNLQLTSNPATPAWESIWRIERRTSRSKFCDCDDCGEDKLGLRNVTHFIG